MTTTTSTSSPPLEEQLMQLLPDEMVFNTRQLMPDMSNLKLAALSFANFGLKAPTQADLDAEAARRTKANKDPQAVPAPGNFTAVKARPGDQGRAMAAKRFGATK